MPRISPSLVRKCNKTNPLLKFLLPACRTIEQSRLEFQWISNELSASAPSNNGNKQGAIKRACVQRSRLVPLQYVLGSQPFGRLEILCQSGVLIPRWETEEWAHELAQRMKNMAPRSDNPVVIWDLCSGTGCIALLLRDELSDHCELDVTAVDCSEGAIELVRKNMFHNHIFDVRVENADILKCPPSPKRIDLLVCNPPYIPKDTFCRETSRSVRIYEPRLALIGDKEFYQNLIEHWLEKTSSFVYEIGDIDQADYIIAAIKSNDELNDIWSVGVRSDANNKPRVVYGFRRCEEKKKFIDFQEVFTGFGRLMH